MGQHLTQNANDKKELKKEIAEIKESTDKTPQKVSADSGYCSSDNIGALKDSKVDGYIATGKGEKDISKITDKIGKKNFSYDSKEDIFICPTGHRLELKSTGKRKHIELMEYARAVVIKINAVFQRAIMQHYILMMAE